jgi:hypothetical protein
VLLPALGIVSLTRGPRIQVCCPTERTLRHALNSALMQLGAGRTRQELIKAPPGT